MLMFGILGLFVLWIIVVAIPDFFKVSAESQRMNGIVNNFIQHRNREDYKFDRFWMELTEQDRTNICKDAITLKNNPSWQITFDRKLLLQNYGYWILQIRENQEKEAQEKRRREEEFYFQRIKVLDAMLSLPPYEFEKFIASIYVRLGYEAEITPPTRDEGKDIILRKDGKTILVECKNQNDTIGREVLQKLYGECIKSRADKCICVSTKGFKLTAIQWANNVPMLELIDGDEILRLVANPEFNKEGIELSSERENNHPKESQTIHKDDVNEQVLLDKYTETSKIKVWFQHGIDRVEIIGNPEDQICGSYHKKIFNIMELQKADIPKHHQNCICTFRPISQDSKSCLEDECPTSS